ncbi:uncharacterized protein [Epargyreus clarus]|uniref:uncharacterized protein n=1 Tax=Epargyreus clarus TaxID=520877 RepID=UPI003C2CC5BD
MGSRAVWWLLVVASASAIDFYHEVPPADFDDYETDNEVETDPYATGPRYHDVEDWKRDLIFFKLLKAVQNNPEEFHRSMEYGVEPNSVQNAYNVMDLKQPFVKRVSNAKENSKPKPVKVTRPRPQPKPKGKKGKFYICYFKLCAFPWRS